MRCDLPIARGNALGVLIALTVLLPAGAAFAQDRAPHKAARWAERAQFAREADDPAAEATAERRAFKAMPEDVDRRFRWATWAAAHGQRDVAIAELRATRDLAPDYVDVAIQLGRVYAWEHRWDEATVTLDAVLDEHPKHPDALLARGDVALWRGEPEEALPFYEAAARQRPGDDVVEGKLLATHVAIGDERALLAWLRSVPLREDTPQRRAVRTQAERGDAPARADVGLVYTFTEQQDWIEGRGFLSSEIGPRLVLGAGVWAQRRNYDPAQRDVSALALASLRIGEDWTLRFEPLYTPDADFAPQWWLDGGVQHELVPRFAWSIDARHARYDGVRASTLYPSLYISPWRLSFQTTGFATWSQPGSTTFAGRLISMFHITDTQRIEWWTQVGTEPIEPLLSRLFEEPTQLGLVLAAVADIRPLTSLRFTYSFVTPLGSGDNARLVPRRLALGLTITHRFRWRSPYREPQAPRPSAFIPSGSERPTTGEGA